MNSKCAKLTTLGVFVITILLLAGCRASAQSAMKPVPDFRENSPLTGSPTQITITVEGPWAYTTNDTSHPGETVWVGEKRP